LISGTTWRYFWEPEELESGQYLVEYSLSDATNTYIAQEELVVRDVADAVWDEVSNQHQEDGTMGELVNKLEDIALARPKIIPGD
jgi:hypothetical protein